MKNKRFKVVVILLVVAFFLTALTIYLNRVVFPAQLKNFVTTKAEEFLKRKVEIGSLRFNWVRGFVVEQVKVYQKDSDQVFVQAQRISAGVIFIPGFKEQQLTIPFINIEQPSAHLVRTSADVWNFSDLLAAPAPSDQPSPVKFTLGGVNIIDGKVRVDDLAEGKNWTELLDHLNVKVGLSYPGVTFDASANLPQKQASMSAQGSYQLLTQNVQAQVRVKNLKPAEYLTFLPPIDGFKLNSGLAKTLDVTVNYSQELISLKGDVIVADLDAEYSGQRYKGNAVAHITQLDFGKDMLLLDGDISLLHAALALGPEHTVNGDFALKKVKSRHDKEGIHIVGIFEGQGLDVQWGPQSFKGNIAAKPITVEMTSPNDVRIVTDLQADSSTLVWAPGRSFKGTLTLTDLNARITDQKNLSLKGKISLTNIDVTPVDGLHISGSIELPALTLSITGDTLSVKTQGQLNNWQVNLGADKNIVLESDFGVNLIYPLNDPHKLQYDGTFALHNAEAKGFACGPIPCGTIDAINLDAKFATDELHVKLLSFVVLGSAVKTAGSVVNFKAPVLDVEASSEKIDLAKLKDVLPQVFQEHGLQADGTASFEAAYQGPSSDISAGKLRAKVQLTAANVSSSKYNQSLSNISGTIEGTPDTLYWNNFTGTYLSNVYTLTGSLSDFKNPFIKTSLEGKDIRLKTEAAKTGDMLSIKTLEGKYFNVAFGGTGTVDLSKGAPVLNVTTKVTADLQDIPAFLPEEQRKAVDALKAKGLVNLEAAIKGPAAEWQNWTADIKANSNLISVMGYSINNVTLSMTESNRKISNLTVDATAYDGKIHAVSNVDLSDPAMPFDLALNVDMVDLHKLKMDIPNLKSEEINGKFYLTSVNKGKIKDITNMQGKGSVAIREGFLTEFKLFKGLLGILNEVMKLGQVTITDVEGNFEIANQKWTTDSLRLKSPTIVLLMQGEVNLDETCDLNVTVDTSAGIIPDIALDVLQTLKIRIYDKISNPKFDRKISVPKVLNTILKNISTFVK